MEFNNPDYDPNAGAVDDEEEGYYDRKTDTRRSFEDDEIIKNRRKNEFPF